VATAKTEEEEIEEALPPTVTEASAIANAMGSEGLSFQGSFAGATYAFFFSLIFLFLSSNGKTKTIVVLYYIALYLYFNFKIYL